MKTKDLEVVVISITIIYWSLTCYYQNICKPVDSSRGNQPSVFCKHREFLPHTWLVTSKVLTRFKVNLLPNKENTIYCKQSGCDKQANHNE